MEDQRQRLPKTRIISVFNNKGGVGKTTMTFHLGHSLALLGEKVLFLDLDPQCNLTIHCLAMEQIESTWAPEDSFVDEEFEGSWRALDLEQREKLLGEARSVHFLVKPTEEGTGELLTLPPPAPLAENLALLPGRLTLHRYEEKISQRWSDLYRGDPLAIRTVTRFRQIVESYAAGHGFTTVLVDTSPSLGALNKVAVMTVDYFVIPCLPDVFSLYGIRNIGKALMDWSEQLRILRSLLSPEKNRSLPEIPVECLGYTIFNAKKYTGQSPWDLAKAHQNYAARIPEEISSHIPPAVLRGLSKTTLREPIGGKAVMHTHNTMPAMAQKYRVPIWEVPSSSLDAEDRQTILGNRGRYEETMAAYKAFAVALMARAKEAEEQQR